MNNFIKLKFHIYSKLSKLVSLYHSKTKFLFNVHLRWIVLKEVWKEEAHMMDLEVLMDPEADLPMDLEEALMGLMEALALWDHMAMVMCARGWEM